MRRVRSLGAALLLCLLATAAAAQHALDTVTSTIDWSAGTLEVTVERPLAARGAAGPGAVSEIQRSIRRDAVGIITPILATIRFDSRRTVADLIAEDESLITRLERAAAEATAVDARASTDLRSAVVTFRVELHDELGSRFVTHDRPAPVPSRLGWVATTEYTGIVIYAAGELPVFGTDRSDRASPALFPGIYYVSDPESLLFRLAEVDQVDPDRLIADGPVAYTDDPLYTGLADRVGRRPLRILASGLFGTAPTDVVITERDAYRIIASEHNRSLIRDGRIVIVVDTDRL